MARSLTPQSAQRSLIWASTSWPPASATSTACIPPTGLAFPFERLGEIKAQTGDLPLVLHGGTGIPEDQIKKAISLGISKINVNTDLQLVFAKGVREYIEAGKDQQGKGFDPASSSSLVATTSLLAPRSSWRSLAPSTRRKRR